MSSRAAASGIAGLLMVALGATAVAAAGRHDPADGVVRLPASRQPAGWVSTASPAAVPQAGSGLLPPIGTHGARLGEGAVRPPWTPVRLAVPSIGVDGPVSAVGVTAGGELGVPPRAGALSWYRYGPGPGDPGSAVIAGHVDFNGRTGVFFRLRDLQVGATVVVSGPGGPRRFVVVARRQYAKAGLPTGDLFATGGPPRLVLITCGGSFDAARHSYRDNVVVYAEPRSAG